VRIYSGADLQWCGLAGTPITPFTIGPTLGVILDDFKVFRLNLENFFRSSLPIMF
jgi:hypothetical protein